MIQVILIIAAALFILFGLAALLGGNFTNYMRNTFWYKTDYDKRIFSPAWFRFDEIVNVALPMILTGVAILVLAYLLQHQNDKYLGIFLKNLLVETTSTWPLCTITLTV